MSNARLAFCSTSSTAIPALFNLTTGVEYGGRHQRRQPKARLVQHEELRPSHHAAADHQHLLLAAGEHAAGQMAPFLQNREHAINLFQAARGLRIALRGRERSQEQVLLDGKRPQDAAALGHLDQSERAMA